MIDKSFCNPDVFILVFNILLILFTMITGFNEKTKGESAPILNKYKQSKK